MIDPTLDDIGRRVVFARFVGDEPEHGVITSFNDSYVFVRYKGQAHSRPTERQDLSFEPLP